MLFTGTTARRSKLLGVLLWGIFALGLAVQVFAPNLKIENNAFVIPSALVSEGQVVLPAELIEKERRLQLFSALLTVGGAIGLAIYYYYRSRTRVP